MKMANNILGLTFGRLTVVGSERIGRRTYAVCLCTCGKICKCLPSNLTGGKQLSCGCLNRENVSKRSRKTLQGQTFGRLTPIRCETRNNKLYWLCRCLCGNELWVRGTSLTSGQTKSCGCLRTDVLSEIKSGEQNFNWKGGVSSDNEKVRKSDKYKAWRTAVFERDNYTCVKCGQRGRNLHAHHIFNFADNPDLRTRLSNGITLCDDCHKAFHGKHTNRHTTFNQLVDFKHGWLQPTLS